VQPVNRFPHRAVPFIAASLLLLGARSDARLSASLTDEHFKRIGFSGECATQQWSLSKDNILEVTIAPAEQACHAEFVFKKPIHVSEYSAFRFSAHGTRPSQHMTVQFVASEGEPPASRGVTVTDEDKTEAMRFARVRRGWLPKEISAIRFIAAPIDNAKRRAPALFTIHDLRLVEAPPRPAEAAAPVPVLPTVPTAPAADPKPQWMTTFHKLRIVQYVHRWRHPRPTLTINNVEIPILPSNPEPSRSFSLVDHLESLHLARHVQALKPHRPSWLRMHTLRDPWRPLEGLLAIAWVLGAVWILRRKKSPMPTPLHPLYEINTRLWKSERDGEGVLRLGGFRRMTLADLKGIKASGFNAVWVMGIWQIGPKVRDISRRYGSDFEGSPFAIADYRIAEELGDETEFQAFVTRAREAGLGVMIDFIPNHMGMDSPWLNEHPEYFIHKVLDKSEALLPDGELEQRYPGYFPYRTPSYPDQGRRVPKTIMVAYGRDPYFYPWIDTAQLDYAQPELRRRLIDILSYWAKIVDGVRCDMAMLVLREQVKVHRHPEMSNETFNKLMPEEFWTEAIRCVKRANPNFVFVAETYWAMEGYLQHLGFDYTYNKPLYEAMCHAFHTGHSEGLLNFLRTLGQEFLQKGVHFLENHDEERAMNALGDDRQKAAAVMMCTLPGVALIHQGQMEGKRERMPVQRVVPLHQETENTVLSAFYKNLLKITALPVLRSGRLHVLYCNNPAFVSYARMDGEDKVIVIINSSNRVERGFVTLTPTLRLETGTLYHLQDVFFDLKPEAAKQKHGVQPSYTYTAPQLINQGLFVELQPYDAHIFRVESTATSLTARVRRWVREFNAGLPLPRAARRLLGAAMTRYSDHHR
jgi:glycosidase